MKKSDLSNKVAIVLAIFLLNWFGTRAETETVMLSQFLYVTGENGNAGTTAELTLNLHSNNPISSWACDLVLPEGMIFQSVAFADGCYLDGYGAEPTSVDNENGSITITCAASEGVGITGTDDAVATVTVMIADTIPSGKYVITLTNIKLVESNGSVYAKSHTEFKWSIMGSSRPFVEERKVWNMCYYDDLNRNHAPTYNYRYFIESDTLISNLSCKKLYVFNENNDGLTEYKMALYESEGKVYFIPNGSTESNILYDFKVPEGNTVVVSDQIHPEWKIEMRNNENRLVETNGVSRHCLLVDRVDESLEDCPSGWWIEGIGSELGTLNTWGSEAGGNNRFFVNCEVEGQEIFNLSDFYSKLKEPDYDSAQKYYPRGTKWTEIRLDTMKYDSWYSNVDGELVPNYETIEYSIRRDALVEWTSMDSFTSVDYVYTNSHEWTDSLAFTINEEHTESDTYINASVEIQDDNEWLEYVGYGQAYQFNWIVGKELYYQDMTIDELVYPDMVSEEYHSQKKIGYYEPEYTSGSKHLYGTIDEVKKEYFGGTKPLNYVDLDGVRIIQGIGVTEWNDGECIFGPIRPYEILSALGAVEDEQRHYRSMLVHFERDGEVLYDVWPEKPVASEPVIFTAGQMATIVLPTEPDASKGKYYRLDRVDGNEIVFEQELHPQAHVPYIIVPSEDFSIELSTLELEGLRSDTVSVEGISFIGSFVREVIEEPEGFYINIIDTTPDCSFENDKQMIGALRAYLLVTWDDPYNHGGTKVPAEKMQIVLHDHGTGIAEVKSEKLKVKNGDAAIYDLNGRRIVNAKSLRGIYIKDRRKQLR